jgi:hypothetical protein
VPGLDLRSLDIRLIEGIDADAVAGDRGGIFPEQEQLTEAAVDHGFEAGGGTELGCLGGAEQAQQGIGAGIAETDVIGRVHDDGQDSLTVLAQRLGDELFDPGRESAERRLGLGEDELLGGAGMADAQPRSEAQSRIVRLIGGQTIGGGGRLGDDGADIGTRESGRHESERGQGAEASSDGGVGTERREEALVGGQPVEWGAGIGDRDHPGRGIDSAGFEGRGEAAPDRVGLHRGPGLRGDDEDGVFEVGADRLGDLIRVRRIDDLEAHARRGGHHLGRQ